MYVHTECIKGCEYNSTKRQKSLVLKDILKKKKKWDTSKEIRFNALTYDLWDKNDNAIMQEVEGRTTYIKCSNIILVGENI